MTPPAEEVSHKEILDRLIQVEAKVYDKLSAVEQLKTRMSAVEDSVVGLQVSVADNTTITNKISGDTGQLVSIFVQLNGAIAVMGWVGDVGVKLIKVLAVLGAVFIGIWAFVQNALGVHK